MINNSINFSTASKNKNIAFSDKASDNKKITHKKKPESRNFQVVLQAYSIT